MFGKDMTPESARSQSQTFLRRNGIQINETLPLIEAPSDLRPRSASDVATRCVVLGHVIGIGFGAQASRLRAALEAFGLFEFASEAEKDLLTRDEHSEQERINATWMVECVQSFAWCLALADLDPFRRCDEDLASHFPAPFADPRRFISGARLRSFDEIYQQADLHYRLHWATRNARLTGSACRAEEGLIGERRKALDWTIGVAEDWDEVPMDT
jgi:hypothetical protein